MIILAIDTSCDETACAIVDGRRVLSSVIYSQIPIQKQWGGVVPTIAKRAHEERIDGVIEDALKKFVRFHRTQKGVKQKYTLDEMIKEMLNNDISYYKQHKFLLDN